jgi:shikimate kinase
MTSKEPHLILFGFPGVGKTTLAKYLSSSYDVPYFDTDELVEKIIGKKRKEVPLELFRSTENEVVSTLPKRPPSVISLGGGTLLSSNNKEILATIGNLVYLHLDLEVLKSRWKTGALPSFVKNEEEFYKERLKHYQSIAADKIDMTDLSLDEAAKEALTLWKSYGKQFFRTDF